MAPTRGAPTWQFLIVLRQEARLAESVCTAVAETPWHGESEANPLQRERPLEGAKAPGSKTGKRRIALAGG